MKLHHVVCLALVLGVVSIAVPSRGSVVERVVATVADRPILLSDVQRRAQPFILRASRGEAAPLAPSTVNEIYREVLSMLVDERLEERAATTAGLTVSEAAVDHAVGEIANSARVTPNELLMEAARQGLPEQNYRDEIRRQLLTGKLIQLRIRGRVRVTEEDARAAYARWLSEASAEERSKIPAYTEVRNTMMARALDEAIARERQVWLRELRRTANVDLRL